MSTGSARQGLPSRRFRYPRRATACVVLLAVVGALPAWRELQYRECRRQFDQALAAIESQDWPSVEQVMNSLDVRYGFESHVFFLRASLLMRQGDHAGALYELSAVHAVDELREPVSLLHGECLYLSGETARAEQVFRQLAVENPKLLQAHRWLAGIYHERGNMQDARFALEQIEKRAPADYRAYRQLGLLYHRDLADNQKAVRYYRLALDRDPPPAERDRILRELGEALILRRDYAGALDMLSDQSEPDAIGLAMMSDCCWSLDRREDARIHLAEAKQINPKERLTLLLEGRMYMEEGYPEQAVAPLQHLVQNDSHDWVGRYRLAKAYQQMGDIERAQIEIQKMQDSKGLRFQLTQLYVNTLDRPDDMTVRDQIAELCQQLGQPELAAKWRRAAVLARQSPRGDFSQTPDDLPLHSAVPTDLTGSDDAPM